MPSERLHDAFSFLGDGSAEERRERERHMMDERCDKIIKVAVISKPNTCLKSRNFSEGEKA